MIEYQDLDHIDGVSISSVCANLYKDIRDDLVMFYFRDGATMLLFILNQKSFREY